MATYIRLLLLLAIYLFMLPPLTAQYTGSIKGTVFFDEEPVKAATIGIKSLNKGTFTDENGKFHLQKIPEGEYEIFISAVGYKSVTKKITIKKNVEHELNIHLEKSISSLEQVVVTGTMTETTIKESPVKVTWISGDVLSKSASENLMDAVQYINGMYNQVDCAVCGTSSLRINGMDGPYTSVLIDGMPVIGALASVYTLNGINPNIIKNLEVIKGPSSTLYGSQAMGGVVNIITVNPRESPTISIQGNSSSHFEHNLHVAVSPKLGSANLLLSSSLYHSGRFIDENYDNFSDITQDTRFTFFTKSEAERSDFLKSTLGAKIYYEDRLGGVEQYSHSIRGSGDIYGESVFTRRFELFGRHDFATISNLRIEGAYAYHHQDSYYGDYHYDAKQQTYFSNLTWKKYFFGVDGELLTGAALRLDVLNQLFNQQELPGGSNESRFVPALFAQYDHIFNNSFRILGGIRADHHQKHGLIFSPRLSLRITPGSHTTFRINTGTGFRIVNLFTEEHEALTGSRQVILAEELQPERSQNITLNINHIIDIGASVLNADVDLFYTRFSNQIIPDYKLQNQIIYSNIDGYAISQGISVNLAHNFIAPLTYMIGVTFQDVYSANEGARQEILFSPRISAVFSVTYTMPKTGVTADYTGRIIGRMKMPDYLNRNRYSPFFTEQNLKFTRKFGSKFEIFAAVKNLFDYTQTNPLIAADMPFSDEFATDYVYGPIQGRRVLAGISLSLD